MMGSRYLFLRLPATSLSTTTLASTWGRRIITEKSAGSLIFFARSPFNARLEENKNKEKRGNTNTTRLLIESRRYYCRTTISSPRSDDPKLKRAGNEYRSEREIAKLCKENKASEAFLLFQERPTIVGAKHLFNFYLFKAGLDAVKGTLQVYHFLVQQRVLPDQEIFSKLMLVCNINAHFSTTLKLYHDMEKYHVPVDSFSFPKIAYAMFKQGDTTVAKKLLDVLKSGVDFLPSAISCRSFFILNNFDDAVWIFDYMLKNNIEFNKNCFIEFLKACSAKGPSSLAFGRKVHSELSKSEFMDDGLVLNHLLQMYAKCGDLDQSIKVFETTKQPDVMLWNLIINLCANHKQPQKSIEIYDRMIEANVTPSEFTFTIMLIAISNLGPNALEMGKAVHKHIIEQKLDSNIILLNTLIRMYNKCGEPKKSLEVYDQIERQKIPTKITFANMLSAISNIGPSALEKGKQIHQQIKQQKQLSTNIILINSLIQMYNLCGKPLKSVEIYDNMNANNITPDEITFTNILRTISNIGPSALEKGKQIHQQIKKHKFESNIKIITSLIQMYDKCGEPNNSLELFDYIIKNEHSVPLDKIALNIILASLSNIGPKALEKGKQIHQHFIQHKFDTDYMIITSLIQMYDKCGESYKSIEVYDRMIENNITPDEVTFINVLSAISNIGPNAIKLGERVHQQIKQHKFDTDMRLINSIIQMYDKCGEPAKSLELYDAMIENNITPNEITFTNILTAISNIGPSALEKGKQIHQQIEKHKFDTDMRLINSLIQMYNKCGEPNTSVELYDKMNAINITPDELSFINALTVISNIGPSALEKGKQIHQQIKEHKFDSNINLITSLIQMYDKCGEPSKSLELHTDLASRVDIIQDEVTLLTVLNACAHLGEVMTTFKQKFKILSRLRNFYYRNNENEARKQVSDKYKEFKESPQYLQVQESFAKAIEKGKQIHHQIASHQDLSQNQVLTTSLMKMYTFCGEFDESEKLFDQLQIKNDYAFHFILITYSYRGSMALERGKKIHQLITQQSTELKHYNNIIVFNSLIQMYNKCGEPNQAVEFFEQLVRVNIAPNEYTYTHVLSALSKIGNGALEKGKELHQRTISEGLDTNTFVLNSLIEMYNKCGEPHKSLEIYDHMVSNNMPLDEYTYRYALEACMTIGPDAFEKGKKIHQDLLNNRVF